MLPVDRTLVYWFGVPPTAAELEEFSNRQLAVKVVDEGIEPDLAIGRAAVFNARPPRVPYVCSRLGIVASALDHGFLVYLLTDDHATQDHVRSRIAAKVWNSPRKDDIRSRTGVLPPHECAENIRRADPGPPASVTLKIEAPPGCELSEGHRFLIARAFSDCTTVSLQPLAGGRSATAYVVQATLTASNVGTRPLPFFMKLDVAEKIRAEEERYRDYARLHIPWYLRPNLDPARCLIGVEQGILVGSFVSQSESLWEAVLDGRGPRYLHALFEDTLMGWRSQAFQPNSNRQKGRLASRLSGVFRWDLVRTEHVERAAQIGMVLSPQTLWEKLLNMPEQSWREAPMHGDMHGENVRVRNGDAIIIDLAKVGHGPLCADAASLEVWLSFEVPPPPWEIPDRNAWTQIVQALYEPSNVARPPNLATAQPGLEWVRACARQTRMFSASLCECDTEYQTAIAVHLLKRACYARSEGPYGYLDEDCYRRALAYYLGSRLVESLEKTPPVATRDA